MLTNFLFVLQMYTTIQMQVWATLGKVDGITSLIIDEFVRYAVEHGISSPQAETVANTIVTLSSTNVRGKIIARLRKVINLQMIRLLICKALFIYHAYI